MVSGNALTSRAKRLCVLAVRLTTIPSPPFTSERIQQSVWRIWEGLSMDFGFVTDHVTTLRKVFPDSSGGVFLLGFPR